MKAVVVYASKYGSTRGIAEFIAEKLRQAGTQAEVRHVGEIHNPGDYDAFVIGSAVYMMHWLKEATDFVTGNHALLANRPVWLFSSGPLGTETRDAQGEDLLTVSEPKEISEFRELINPATTGSSSEYWIAASLDSATGCFASYRPPVICFPKVTSATGTI